MKPVYSSGKLGSENKFFISASWKTAEKPGKVLVNPWKMCYDPSLPLGETKMEP